MFAINCSDPYDKRISTEILNKKKCKNRQRWHRTSQRCSDNKCKGLQQYRRGCQTGFIDTRFQGYLKLPQRNLHESLLSDFILKVVKAELTIDDTSIVLSQYSQNTKFIDETYRFHIASKYYMLTAILVRQAPDHLALY